MVRCLEQRLIVTPIALANRTIREPFIDALLHILVLWFVAASVDICHVPSDAVASSYTSTVLEVIARFEVFGQRFAGQTSALIAKDGRRSC